ncbi:MAG: hypothetical protein LBS50_10100 [Prevotellaceae bacterium]|nr:hypothetical protein [Prevotellaceae bacterium]
MPTLNEINFSYETEKEYTDLQDNKIKSDKIDIYINKLKLKKIWKENDENVYFAIECKRIEQMNDTNINLYIDDIVKCTNREHRKLRLPFEGQLAFIENQDITHIALSNRINEKLKSKTAIVTDAFLDYLLVNQNYQGTYLSKHKRNNQKLFSIYHLFLDYSEIVVK